jgi:hypothetical protein
MTECPKYVTRQSLGESLVRHWCGVCLFVSCHQEVQRRSSNEARDVHVVDTMPNIGDASSSNKAVRSLERFPFEGAR